jgi:hypothetical protein
MTADGPAAAREGKIIPPFAKNKTAKGWATQDVSRERRLTASELTGRLRAPDALNCVNLRPRLGSAEDTGSKK